MVSKKNALANRSRVRGNPACGKSPANHLFFRRRDLRGTLWTNFSGLSFGHACGNGTPTPGNVKRLCPRMLELFICESFAHEEQKEVEGAMVADTDPSGMVVTEIYGAS